MPKVKNMKLGIIGGSGLYNIDNIDKLKAMVFDLFISSPKSSYFVTDCIVIY